MDTTERPSFRRGIEMTRGGFCIGSVIAVYAGNHTGELAVMFDPFVTLVVSTGDCSVQLNGTPEAVEALAAALTEAAACCRALIAAPLIAEAA